MLVEEGPDPSPVRFKIIQLSPKIAIPSKLHWSVGKDPWVPKGNSMVWERGLARVSRLNSRALDCLPGLQPRIVLKCSGYLLFIPSIKLNQPVPRSL